MMFRRALAWAAVALCSLAAACSSPRHAGPVPSARDPLPSWKEGPAKKAILDFLDRAASVPPAERVAVFDNDGTLWCEQPMYVQARFALDRVRDLAPQHPEWSSTQPFKAALEGDAEFLAAGGAQASGTIIAATHAGLTTDEFAGVVQRWLATARHPATGRPYTEMVYLPMREVLDLFRARGFKVFIVSGGGADFMRVFTEEIYDVPPERVVGSTNRTEFRMNDGVPTLVKLADVEHVNDGPGKPAGIHSRIGRRPLAAFGNSDGDLQMLEWTALAPGPNPRLAVIVRHDDADREWAYDRASKVGKLDKALDEAASRGWIVVGMKNDWKAVFPASSASHSGESK
jgi:phosphoglycolate phosphatase-like HAD superfamily hydrolase